MPNIPKSAEDHLLPSDFRLVLPDTLRTPDRPDDSSEADLVASVGRAGVLMPPLAFAEADGGLAVLAGVRRVHAALELGQPLVVRVVRGTRSEALRAALDEQILHRKRSTVERAWEVSAFIEAAQTEGSPVSTRALAEVFRVSVGTAHNLRTIGSGLSPERVACLAEAYDVSPMALRKLSVRAAMSLATCAPDEEASVIRKVFAPPGVPPDPGEDRAGQWSAALRILQKWCASVLAWVAGWLLRLSALALRGRGG